MKKLLLVLFAFPALLLAQRKDYAVFFPVSTYTGGWASLGNTLKECNELSTDLRDLYGFAAEVLPNKNKQEIRAKLVELASRKYSPGDQLLLYFSMHGYFDEAGEAGCLCPAGALLDDPGFDTWLLHTELRTLVARIPCEHVLVVLDACYSGTFGGKKGSPAPDWQTPDCHANISKALSRKTRYYISSGAKERTPAVSELAKKMRSALGGRYNGEDGILSLKELLGVLSEANPAPKDGEFTGDLGGGFVFVPKEGCSSIEKARVDAAPDDAELNSWTYAKQKDSEEAYQFYLSTWPKGRYQKEAQQALNRKTEEKAKANTSPNDADQNSWTYAKQKDTEEAYQFYLSTWPTGRYKKEAQQALDGKKEEKAWQAAITIYTTDAFETYKKSYCPGGLHCADADRSIQNIAQAADDRAWVAAKEANTNASFEEYKSAYPNGRHFDEANAKITALNNLGYRIIRGKVSDSSGEPLVGASIILKGLSLGTVSDIDGNYTIRVPKDYTGKIKFSYSGYKSRELSMGTSDELNAVLK